jgi:pimeloyl-ACP methyl ester carboxylesterase
MRWWRLSDAWLTEGWVAGGQAHAYAEQPGVDARWTDRPVALLHGWGLNAHAYRPCLEVLGRDHSAVVAPPVGEADGLWNAPGAVAAMARRLESLAAPPIVIGHSLGGGLATVLAATRPDLVSHLVLVDAVGMATHGRSVASWLSGIPRYLTCLAPGAVASLAASTALHPARVLDWMSAGAWALHADLESDLIVVGRQTPVTVIWGSEDRLLPPESGARMAALLGVPLVTVRGDHDWPLRRPTLLARLVASIPTSAPGEIATHLYAVGPKCPH